MKRSSITRSSKPLKRSPINRRGKKTTQWERVRAQLKLEFAAAGITQCEIREDGCWTEPGGFAHPRKRRHLFPEEIYAVVLACNPCHDVIERLPEDEMAERVYKIIKDRDGAIESGALLLRIYEKGKTL